MYVILRLSSTRFYCKWSREDNKVTVTTNESNGLLRRVGGVRGAAFYAVVLAAIALPIALLQIFLAFPLIALIDPAMANNPHLIHDVAFMGLIG